MLIAAAILGLAAVAPLGKAPSDQPTITHELAITSSLELDGKTRFLRFTLRNISGRAVTFYSSDLPWNAQHPTGLVVAAAQVNPPSKPLQPRIKIESSDLGPLVSIGPGGHLSGSLNLNELFPDLATALENEDVCVFWHDTIELLNPARFNEASSAHCIQSNHYGEVVGDPVPLPPN